MIQDETVFAIANYFLSELWGWILAVIVVVAYAAIAPAHGAGAQEPWLPGKPTSSIALRRSASRR